MTRDRIQSFTCQDEGRVDRASGDLVPRSVFSLPDTVIEVEGRGLVKKSFRVRPGDRVTVSWKEEVMEGLVAEDIPLDVIWEDESILVTGPALWSTPFCSDTVSTSTPVPMKKMTRQRILSRDPA